MRDRSCFLVAGLMLALAGPLLEAANTNSVQHSGAPYAIDIWGTDDGLPQNSIIAMTQTRDGYLWLGTLDGLVRFDGLRFKVFDESNTPALPSSQIVSLFEDRGGNLWLGTETAGAALVAGGKIQSLDIGRGSRAGRLLSVCEDARGAVWLYTADGQLCRHQAGQVQVYRVDAEIGSRARVVIAEADGTLWVGNDRSLYYLATNAVVGEQELPLARVPPLRGLEGLLASRDGGHWRFAGGRVQKWTGSRLVRDLGPYPWTNAPLSAACEDREGNLVVGTLGAGVFWYEPDGTAKPVSRAEGLSNDFILSLISDREGSLWIGTDGGGLNRLRRLLFEVVEPSRERVVQSVCEDREGGLWIGYNGGGVDHWRGGQGRRYASGPPGREAPVRTVLADRAGHVWMGTWGAGLWQLQSGEFLRVTGTEILHPVVHCLHEDRAGRLWVGTAGGLARWEAGTWRVFTTLDGVPGAGVRAVMDDAAGNLWVGTEAEGLVRGQGDRFEAVAPPDARPGESITALWVDRDDALWVGTRGRGLLRLKGGRWARFTTREGLLSNSVRAILEDEEGYLWLGSNAGLLRVARGSFDAVVGETAALLAGRSYGRLDGLPTRECTLGSQPAAWRSREGRLWFPTIQGLAGVDIASLKPNPHPPLVSIEDVLLDGQTQRTNSLRGGWPAELRVPAGRERVEIHYTSLNLAAPDRARFRYWLEHHEKGWTEAGATRVARFSRLPPGHYRFHVTACNEDGLWNESGTVLGFQVEPPFWRTWWFLGACVLALLGSVVGLVHRVSTQRLHRQLAGLRQQQMIERERSRIARDIHDQVGANLTQVALLGELIETDKDFPEDVEGHAQQITKTARETTRVLDEIVWAVNPAYDTLESLVTYFTKHAQDYLTVAGVRYRVDVPAQLPATPLPPDVRHNVFLAAKEAVTNVVRHARATEAHIRLRVEPSAFVLEVEDNGRGLGDLDAEAARLRNGLRNMQKRMEEVGGTFHLGPASGGGALARLTCPLRSPKSG